MAVEEWNGSSHKVCDQRAELMRSREIPLTLRRSMACIWPTFSATGSIGVSICDQVKTTYTLHKQHNIQQCCIVLLEHSRVTLMMLPYASKYMRGQCQVARRLTTWSPRCSADHC